MIEPRVTSRILVSALIRLANQEGGFAAVMGKGDETAGTVLLQLLEKGHFFGLYERMPDLSGHTSWQPIGTQNTENEQKTRDYVERRRARDRDLWLLELDVPDAERFIVGLSSIA
jgi:hypothetical protein